MPAGKVDTSQRQGCFSIYAAERDSQLRGQSGGLARITGHVFLFSSPAEERRPALISKCWVCALTFSVLAHARWRGWPGQAARKGRMAGAACWEPRPPTVELAGLLPPADQTDWTEPTLNLSVGPSCWLSVLARDPLLQTKIESSEDGLRVENRKHLKWSFLSELKLLSHLSLCISHF